MANALAFEVTRWIDHRPLAIVESPPAAGLDTRGTRWGKMAFLASLDPAAGITPFCSFVFGSISRQDMAALMRLIGSEGEPQKGALRPTD